MWSKAKLGLSSKVLFGGAYIQDIVSTDEAVSILLPQLFAIVFLRLLKGQVHIPVQASQNPSITNAAIQLDHHGSSHHLNEKQGCTWSASMHSTPSVSPLAFLMKSDGFFLLLVVVVAAGDGSLSSPILRLLSALATSSPHIVEFFGVL